MKYKIIVKTIDIVEIEADGADAAIEKLKSQMEPRIVASPITFEVIEEPKEDT